MKVLNINTMTSIKKVTLVTLMAVLMVSCDDFGDINDDPNNPSQVRTDLLLTNAQRSIGGDEDNLTITGAVMGTVYVQYLAETQYTDNSQYANTEANFNGWYTGPLQDLETIIRLNTDEETRAEAAATAGSNANQIAVARILKAYFYQFMTDRWGMLPYSEALQGRDNFSPAYDLQSDIYVDIINELNEAVGQMDDGAGVSGDILFGGNMEQWALFANSLRARASLRLADVADDVEIDPAAEFADAIADGVIEEDVFYPYTTDPNNENPWYTAFRTRTDYAISDVIADYMKGLDDYRLTVFANPAPDEDNEDGVVTLDEIVGMPYSIEDAGEVTNDAISFPGSAIGAGGPGVGQADAPLPILTVAEMNFAMAEAVERGWITGVAEDHYYDGIEASWRQWGVYNTTDFTDYIAQTEVLYNTADWEERVGVQKWLALFPHGYEGWAEWRRLGYPILEPHEFALNESGEIPVRFVYPSTESQINSANYNAAVDAQGPDTPDTHLWWDVE